MKKLIDRFCKSRLARNNRGCQTMCNRMKKGWLYGIHSCRTSSDVMLAEYLDTLRFRSM